MFSGSLCTTSFIKVEFNISLVVIGQGTVTITKERGPLRGTERQQGGPLRELGGPWKKPCLEGAGRQSWEGFRGSWEGLRGSEGAERAYERTWRVSKAAERATEKAGLA